jgi:hypothetical protein
MVFAGVISAQTGEVVKDSSYTVASAGKFIRARYIEYEDGSSVTTTLPALTADELLLKKKSEIEQQVSAMAKDVAYVSFFRRNLTEIKRQSDIYIFCLLSHREQLTLNPLNIDQWEFYLLPTAYLDKYFPLQNLITIETQPASTGVVALEPYDSRS